MTRTIASKDQYMGTAEAYEWNYGDRVDYMDPADVDDAAWDRVKEMLSRRGLRLVDDGGGYVVSGE